MKLGRSGTRLQPSCMVQTRSTLKHCKIIPRYPRKPDSAFKYSGRTYWREYDGEKYGIYFSWFDIEEYPYYLLSAREMTDKEDAGWLKDYINRNYAEEVQVDEKL